MSVKIIKPGILTTLQDLGRPTLRHLGIPRSGAADRLSCALANRLVGNHAAAVTMEMTLAGASLSFHSEGRFAVAGAQTSITLNGKLLHTHVAHTFAPGDELTVDRFELGCRAYLAVSGGFEGADFLGSAGTYLPAAIGGYQGRPLAKDDQIAIGTDTQDSGVELAPAIQPAMAKTWTLRVTAGPEFTWLSENSQQALFAHGFKMGRRADRMGGILEGPPLDVSDATLASCPVFPGTIQCPPSGTPFLLMADAQTTGGYARIAQVIRADRHCAGQIRPGDRIRLWQLDADGAAETLWEKTQLYAELGIPARVF